MSLCSLTCFAMASEVKKQNKRGEARLINCDKVKNKKRDSFHWKGKLTYLKKKRICQTEKKAQ